jgi:putative DNA primase/helicase
MGVLHADSGTFALDADMSGDHVALALAAGGVDYADLLSAGTPAIRGNPAKPAKLLYRTPPGLELRAHKLPWMHRDDSAKREVVFELRTHRVQDVLPPTIHPETREPYAWVDRPRCREDIPCIPEALLRLAREWSAALPAMEAACPWAPPPAPKADTARTRGTDSERHHDGPSVIAAFNAQVPVTTVLARNGYKQCGTRWVAPGSTSGTPGVVVFDGRVYSHHGSDALAGDHSHDAFSAFTLLEHQGNVTGAVRAASLELGLNRLITLLPSTYPVTAPPAPQRPRLVRRSAIHGRRL